LRLGSRRDRRQLRNSVVQSCSGDAASSKQHVDATPSYYYYYCIISYHYHNYYYFVFVITIVVVLFTSRVPRIKNYFHIISFLHYSISIMYTLVLLFSYPNIMQKQYTWYCMTNIRYCMKVWISRFHHRTQYTMRLSQYDNIYYIKIIKTLI